MRESDHSPRIPKHIAVVMDGNGRWAKKRFLPRTAGHHAGVNATRAIVENCDQLGIEALTVFAFSSENWKRPEKEVNSLMSIFISTLKSEMMKLKKLNVCVKFIGDRTAFPQELQTVINETEIQTVDNTGLALTIAANYGGRWDIAQACRRIAQKVSSGELSADAVDESLVSQEMCLSDLPAIDLFIRTGGESRVSNFLLWQLAYAELYFTDTLWPDFNDASLESAITWYGTRQRRFGETPDQVENKKVVTK
ncbi:MAG: isoprenyl transferase [Gammaproteobacteria bacterium]|nr:isoprenyl transferase [Gammaproteobacteria bacterium]